MSDGSSAAFADQGARSQPEDAVYGRVSPSPTLKNPGSDTGTRPVIGAFPSIAPTAARSRSSLTPYVTRYVPTRGNWRIRYGLPNAATTTGFRAASASIQAATGCGIANRPSPSTRLTYAAMTTVLAASAARPRESITSLVAEGPMRANVARRPRRAAVRARPALISVSGEYCTTSNREVSANGSR